MSDDFEVARGTIGELFANVSEAVLVARPGRVLAWNPSAEAMLGMNAAQATAEGADLSPAFGAATEGFWDLVGSGGEARLDCAGGSERVLQASAWHLGGDISRPTVVVLRDVSAEQRHLVGLSQLNALARGLVAERPLGATLAQVADVAKELTGADFSAVLVLGEGSHTEVAHFAYNAPRELFPERLPRAVGLLAIPIRTRAVARITDIRGHPEGVGIPVEHPPIAALLAVPIGSDAQVLGEVVVARRPGRDPFDDVDEALMGELGAHAASALTLAQLRRAHHEAEAARRSLLDVALHDIGTPITVARGFLSTLRTYGPQLSDEEREEAFEAIADALERIQALAEGPLFGPEARGGDGDGLQVGPVDVAELVHELGAHLGGYRPDVGVKVAVEPDWSPPFMAHRGLVRELLDNLVTNAIKHSPPGEVVTLTARPEGDSVRFDVADRGLGIDPAEQERVFEHRYRTAHSVAAGIPGTGLGLWMVRRLADLHGAKVGVASRSGQGATFWASFPLGPREGPSPRPEASD